MIQGCACPPSTARPREVAIDPVCGVRERSGSPGPPHSLWFHRRACRDKIQKDPVCFITNRSVGRIWFDDFDEFRKVSQEFRYVNSSSLKQSTQTRSRQHSAPLSQRGGTHNRDENARSTASKIFPAGPAGERRPETMMLTSTMTRTLPSHSHCLMGAG